jgi:hypothetical protein
MNRNPFHPALGALAVLLLAAASAAAAPSDGCIPSVPDPNGAWAAVPLPPELAGNWYRYPIWNVGIYGSHVQISNLPWEYLGIEEQNGVYRLIIHTQFQGQDLYRGQYYRITVGAGTGSQACLIDQCSTGVVSSEAEARTSPLAAWDVLTYTNDVPWEEVALPWELTGRWYYNGIWNIGISPACVQMSNMLWCYASVETACLAAAPGLEDRVYRIIVWNTQNGDWRAQYYRCIDVSGANPVMLTTTSGVVASEEEARADRHFDWHDLTHQAGWDCPDPGVCTVSVEPSSWGRIKSMYK